MKKQSVLWIFSRPLSAKAERELVVRVALFGGIVIALVFAGMSHLVQARTQAAVVRQTEAKLQTLELSLEETRAIVSALTEGNTKLASDLERERSEREEAEQAAVESRESLALLQADVAIQKETLARSDLTSLVKKWSPRVVRLQCQTKLPTGLRTAKASGVVTAAAGTTIILTNKHVVETQSVVADTCRIIPLDGDQPASTEDISVEAESDLAYLDLGSLVSLAGQTGPVKKCSERPTIGDEVVILGYPSVGAEDGITATEGIISGFDDEYYITSAKIERGNSGGAAIHVKNDCLLGLPTIVVAGQVESLARILAL